jgi:hypothetical protein
MRFLIGLIFGTAIAIGLTSPPDTRGRLVATAMEFFKQIHLPEKIPAGLAATPEQEKPAEEESKKVIVQAQTQQQDNTDSLDTRTSPAERTTGAVGANDTSSSLLSLSLVQAAWSPFYSQASANGFAAKLERHLEREFRVVKNGPANYEVVFDYADETERQQVLETIHAITGYEPQTQRGRS